MNGSVPHKSHCHDHDYDHYALEVTAKYFLKFTEGLKK